VIGLLVAEGRRTGEEGWGETIEGTKRRGGEGVSSIGRRRGDGNVGAWEDRK